MPVPKRHFYFRFAAKQQQEQKRAMEKSRGVNEASPSGKKESAKVPGFVANQVSSKR